MMAATRSGQAPRPAATAGALCLALAGSNAAALDLGLGQDGIEGASAPLPIGAPMRYVGTASLALASSMRRWASLGAAPSSSCLKNT